MVTKALVVTADASHAQFYLSVHNQLTILEHIEHPEGRLHEQDFTNKEHDANTCPYEHGKKEHDEVNFSKELVNKIYEHSKQVHTEEVLVFAPPKFLGMIKHDKIPHELKIQWIAKDFMHSGNKDLEVLKRYISENTN